MKLTAIELGRINDEGSHPKFLQIADRIRELIDSGRLELGDRLPSVNQVINHFSVSRDTAVKAYQELKNRGVVESTPNKAYFVSNVLIHDDLKRILLLTDAMTPYKEQIYYGLIDTLEPGYYIDLVTHSDNFDVLKSVYEKARSSGNCVSYLIIPTAAQSCEYNYFQFINPGNLLFLDRRIPDLPHPAVWQDFREGFFEALTAESALLKKYARLIFLTKYFTNSIIEEMKEGLARFADSAAMAFTHQHTLFTDKEIKGKIQPRQGDLFVILDDHLLLETLAACRDNNLQPGRDVGLIVINDGPFYEHLPIPVSVLTADFYRMGVEAAGFVMNGTCPSAPIPTRLTVRESLRGQPG